MIKCTIAIPVYNREDFIRRAVDSALAQGVPDLEVLVVDNCSTDHTWDVLRTYHDSRLRLVKNENNLGLFGNCNRALQLARGKYFRLLCSDDKLPANCLAYEIDMMEQHANIALLSTCGRRVDERGHILGMQANHFPPGIYDGASAIIGALWFQAHYALNPFNYPSGILIRRSVALLAGEFDTSMRMSGDVDYFLRILQHGDLAVVHTTGCDITIHAGQEGSFLVGNISIISEIFAITDRYRLLLNQAGVYSRVQQQLGAYAMGLAFKYWRAGLRIESKAHMKLARTRQIRTMTMLVAVFRLLGLRLLLRLTGKRILPIQLFSKQFHLN